MHKYLFLFLFFFVSCAASKPMTLPEYQQVPIGENASHLNSLFGAPYEIKDLSSGKYEYTYIERVSITSQKEIFRRYIFVIQGNKVIEKRMTEEAPSSFQYFSN